MGIRTSAVLMPEATPNLNDTAKPRQHQVGFSGQLTDVQAITETHSMNHAPNGHFG